jgi:hypothetical protein
VDEEYIRELYADEPINPLVLEWIKKYPFIAGQPSFIMTASLLKDYQKYAARDERAKIIKMFEESGSACSGWAIGLLQEMSK